MKSKKFLRLTFIGLFCSGLLLAQNPLDFFPHHLGDLWEYWWQEIPPGYTIVQNEITKDSLGTDGRYYIETTWFGNFIVDTAAFEVYDNRLLYKLDADSGHAWIAWQDSTGQEQYIAVVSDVYPDIILNHPVIVKVIDYYSYTVGALESLWVETHYLASDFGFVRRDIEFSAPEYLIKGAIIDSVLYGNVTSIEQVDKERLSKTYALHQNYPNPFNPVTMIEYNLPVAAEVELTVYDLLGRPVQTLVNSRQPAGNYQVVFDGSKLSSGVYIYRLKINNKAVISRKMVLIK